MEKFAQIKKLGEIRPSKDFCVQSKKRLMQKITQDQASWVEKILLKFQTIKPMASFELLAKERLFYKMNQPQNIFRILFELISNKRMLSFATATSFLFVSVFAFSMYSPKTVEASNEVKLLILKGNPQIKQLGENWTDAKQMYELKIGDRIRTDQDDLVEVIFFDNSITRLAGNSEIVITGFKKENTSEFVSIELERGEIWNKVIQLLTETSDFIVQTHNSITSASNATFNIEVEKDTPTKIKVIDHLVNVKILQDKDKSVIANTKVTGGYGVEVEFSNQKTVAQAAQITPIDTEIRNGDWYIENLEKDKAHIEKMQQKNEKNIIASAGILPGSPLYPVKESLEALTKKEVEPNLIQSLKLKLKEAEALILREEEEKGQKTLNEFAIDVLNASTQSGASLGLDEMLLSAQEKYITILPDSKLYLIKEKLRTLRSQIANNNPEISRTQTAEILFETQDLIQKESFTLAKNLLASLAIEENIDQNQLQTDENKKEILFQKTEELQLLKSIQDTLLEKDNAHELLPLVEKMTQTTIDKIALFSPPIKKKTVLKTKPKLIGLKKLTAQEKADNFFERIQLYSSERGQKNTLNKILNEISDNKKNIQVLVKLRNQLPLEQKHLVTRKILEITRK